MKTNTKQTVGRSHGALRWTARITGVTKVLGGILLLALLHNPGQAFSATLPPSYSVTLAWNASPSSDVTGYRVYYGAASGIYTNSADVGTVMSNTVAGLASGGTYFFAVVAYNAAGLESPVSNEISYVPGQTSVQLRVAAGRQMILTVAGQIGSTYNLQASTDLINWTVISTGLVPAGGTLDVTDPNAASFPKRFYRTR